MFERLMKGGRVSPEDKDFAHLMIFCMNLCKKLNIKPDEFLDMVNDMDGALLFVMEAARIKLQQEKEKRDAAQ